jgi:hypothetical protein
MSPVFQYSPYDNSRFGATIAELLAHQGDIRARQALTVGDAQARAAEQSGNAWGSAIANIGQTIAAIPQQIQQAKQQQQQSAYQQAQIETQRELARQTKLKTDQGIADRKALDELFAQPGGIDEVLARTPGHLRQAVIEDRKDLETYKAAQRKARDEARQSQQNYFGRLAVSIRRNNYDPAWILGALHDAREEYADDPAILKQIDTWREQTIADPTSMHQVIDAAIGQSSFADELKPKAPIEVSPGATLVDPTTKQLIYQAPDRPQRPVSVSPGATLIDPTTKKPIYTAPAAPEKSKPEGLTPNASLEATLKLRDRFVRETQAARTVEQQFNLMKSSMDAVNRGDMAAGSQGVLVTFQKILDPTSVVRESEYARSGAGQSLLNRLQGQWDNIVKGGAKVPAAELQKFVNLAQEFVRNQAEAAKQTREQIDAIATEYGLKPENITRELGAPSGVKILKIEPVK